MNNHLRQPNLANLLGLSGIAFISLSASSLYGAGYNLRNQSASGLGVALSSEAVDANNAAAQFNNPALISRMKGTQFSIGLNRTFLEADFNNGSLKSTAEKESNIPTNEGDTTVNGVSDGAVIPTMAMTHAFNDEFSFGLSINVPWASSTDYGNEWAGRYHASETKLVGFTVTPAISYAVNSKLSFGAGIVYQQFSGELSSMIDMGSGTAQGLKAQAQAEGKKGNLQLAGAMGQYAGRLPTNADGRLKFTGSGSGFGMVLGTHYEVVPGQEIGFSYRSPTKHILKGDAKFDYPDFPESPFAANLTAGVKAQFKDSDAEAEITTPEIISLGYAYRNVQDANIFANVTYTRWSVFEDLVLKSDGIPTGGESTTKLDWQDSLYVGVGGDYQLNDDFLLRAGLAYEQAAATDEYRTPRTPDSDRRIITLGTNYKVNPELNVDFSYGHYIMDTAKISLSESQEGSRGRGDLEGELDLAVNIFMIQMNANI